ncbi:MAG: efflux RND transporter permease subunit [Deltaproteobacteria bacterium]|nr:efflux RND transporter permease subunit [Deltaproteobacteria bacterium]
MARSPVDVFVRRPVLASVLSLFILLLGLRAAFDLPVQQYPRIDASSLVIRTVFVGASAADVKGFVTEPIERAVSAVPDIDYVDSTTTAGVSVVTVWLEYDADSAQALAQASAQLDAIAADLPEEAEPPAIEVRRADRPQATFYLAVTSSARSLAEISEYLAREVQPALSSLPGVQRIGIEGARPPAMRVWLDPIKLAGFNLGARDIAAALTRNNLVAPIGSAENADVETDLRADTVLQRPEEFERIVLTRDRGATVRLSDVARVELGEEEVDYDVRLDTTEAVYLSVWPAVGANEIELAAALYAALDAARAAAPRDIKIETAYDGTLYTKDALAEIAKTLGETILIVGAVVVLFLGSVRTALVPLVAIPISLLGAVAAMAVMGFSLNLLTILAVVLAVGLVVDDAIVVVENTIRHVREGKPRTEAALLTVRQLFFPIISMTVTLAAVYAPIGVLGGLTGALFKEFAFTLAMAVLVSGVVALTLSPAMSAALATTEDRGAVAKASTRMFERIRSAYGPALDAALAHRGPVLFFAAVTMALTPLLYGFSLRELAPVEDHGSINVVLQSAPDASLEYTVKYANETVERLRATEGRDYVWSVRTPDGGFGGLELVPWKQRDVTAPSLLHEVFLAVGAQPGIRVFPILPSALPNAGNYDVELVVLSTASPERMLTYAQELVREANASGNFIFADTDLKIDRGGSRLEIDRDRVADLGMTPEDVASQLGIFLSGAHVSRFEYQGRSYKVIPQLEDALRLSPATLDLIRIRTPSGKLLPLASMARLRDETTPRALGRFQQLNAFRVFGGLVPGTTKETGLQTIEEAAARILPGNYSIDYAGESRQLRREGQTLAGVLAISILSVYLLLVAQFQSFRDPLVVLFGSVPLALSGALIFTFTNFATINVFTQIGLITLVGLVAKNGILIVEFANDLQERGLGRVDAAREAAMVRLRPVLMTTIATVVGHLPLVLVSGPGAGARNSIGFVLVGGMIIGTLFTLAAVPVLYSLFASEKQESRSAAAGAVPASAAAAAR